jgi:cytochrome P450
VRGAAVGRAVGFVHPPDVDLVERFAFPFPGFAAFSLLGFPVTDTDMLKEWSRNRVLLTYGRLPEAAQVATARDVVAMWGYVKAFVGERVAHPADDLTSDLARLAAEQPEQLNPFDIVNIVYSMALAGHETTCNTIANGMHALLAHPDQWRALVEEPGRIPNAVEEILRFDGPVLYHRRVAKLDAEIGGVNIPRGSRVMLCFASADRDPAQFGSSADQFLVERPDAESHLAFGKGPHFCLGAPLARLEARITLELLTTRLPHMTLVPGQDLRYSPNALFRGPTVLRVVPRPSAAGRT